MRYNVDINIFGGVFMANPNPDVGRGCLDCLHKETPTTKLPCRDCERWNKWQPKDANKSK